MFHNPLFGGWTLKDKQGKDLAPYIIDLRNAVDKSNRKTKAIKTLVDGYNNDNPNKN